MNSLKLLALAILGLGLTACTHSLEVRNLHSYRVPFRVANAAAKPVVAVRPFGGQMDDLFWFNAIVERMSQDPSIEKLRVDYSGAPEKDPNPPDLIVTITSHADYRSSGWNFLVNWPGFLVWAPAWNGYVYYADINTRIDFVDRTGKVLGSESLPMSYSIRQAEMDRTIFTGLTWLEVSVLAFVGGIYNANSFDRDIIGDLELHVKDNYAGYTYQQVASRVELVGNRLVAEREAAAAAAAAAVVPEGGAALAAPTAVTPAPTTP